MKKLLCILLCSPIWAANIYFGSAGNDSTGNGSISTPYKTFGRTLSGSAPIAACGDTIIDIADGSFVNYDAALPYFAGCNKTTTVQSSKWNLFPPAGTRTNPTNDSSNYGKGQVTNGVSATSLAETHGTGLINGGGTTCILTQLTPDINYYCDADSTSHTWPDLANGSQVYFDLAQGGNATQIMPSGLTQFTKYYVRDCVVSLGTCVQFNVALTPGGTAVNPGTCTAPCILNDVILGVPIQVNVSTSTFTNNVPVNYPLGANWVNGIPVTFAATGAQQFGTAPAPLQLDTTYYVCNLSGQSWQVATDSGCSNIVTLTNIGSGPLASGGNQIPNNWAFRGLEIEDASGGVFNFLIIGNAQETSSLLGSASRFEFDHVYLHQQGGSTSPSTTGVLENARYLWIHDSWISGFTSGEAHAVSGCGAIGPTQISNNFLEGSGENTIYGGCGSQSGATNQAHTFTSNYYFKPPPWKVTQAVAIAVHGAGGSGSGYAVNDTFSISGGGGNATGIVKSVSGGVVTAVAFTSAGSGYTSAGNVSTTATSGSGTGLVVDITITVYNHVPTGNCWYDATSDPLNAGGEWYQDSTLQWYQCGSDLAWHTTASTPFNCNAGTAVCGSPFFKDIAEHKNGLNFTYIGNVLNYSWAQAQSGEAWNNSAEPGSGPGMQDRNITISYNAVFHVYEPFVRVSFCGFGVITCPQPSGNHITTNNLFVIDPNSCGVNLVGCGYLGFDQPIQWSQPMPLVNSVIEAGIHNTTWGPDSGFQTNNTPAILDPGDSTCAGIPYVYNVTHKNNLHVGDYHGQCWTPTSSPNSISAFYITSTFTNNVLKGADSTGYNNTGGQFNKAMTGFPANNAAIGFSNASQSSTNVSDFCLGNTSPYSAQNGSATLLSDDGTDLGVDCQMLAMMTSGAKAGVRNWDVAAHLFYDIGSTSVVIRYTAPTSAACTATLYSAPARISGNQVAQVADSAATSVQNGLDRNLLITGLSASTAYYPKLDCGNNIVMIGTGGGQYPFTTKAAGSGTTNFPFLWSAATAMQYGSTLSGGAIVSPTVLSAATTQPIPVVHGTPEYAQVGTTGPITILIKP